MFQFKKSLTSLLLFLLISSVGLQAQRELINHSYDDKSKTTAKLTPLVGTLPSSGYMPLRLTLKNGTKSEKNWTLEFNSQSRADYYYGRNTDNPNLTSKFSYSCPPESSKTYDILVPLVTSIPRPHTNTATSSLSIKLTSSGNAINDSIDCNQHMDLPSTLLSTKLYVQHSSKFNSLIPASSRGYRSGNEEYASEFTPSNLSEDWRAYSGFDAMICTDEDWLEMSAGAQNAILEWNRLGGHLLIYQLNAASNFKSLKIDESETNKNKTEITRSFGKVTLAPLANVKSLVVTQAASIINNTKNDSAKILAINENYERDSTGIGSAWSLQKALGKLSFSPVYLILILIAFGILVGPVNLFVFAKAGQRHRLFITTPIIALGASLLLVLLIIIQDGFGGHGQRVQLVEVRADGGENKAYVWQEQVARTGVILGGSFETSSPAYMSPVPVAPSRFSRVTRDNGGGASNYVAQHGENGLAASGDWFQSRSVHGHYLESVIPTRGRITLKSNQGAPVVNSSFDYKIKSLIYIDDSGQAWAASNIASGESKELSPSTPVETLKLIHEHHANMSKKLQEKLETLRQRKNHFVAITDEAPAISTLDSIKWTYTESIITGPVVR